VPEDTTTTLGATTTTVADTTITAAEAPGGPAGERHPRREVALERSKIRFPLAFEQNVGQTAPEVDFLARSRGYSVFLTGGDAVVALGTRDGGFAVRMSVVGSADAPAAVPHDRQPGSVNYFIGEDPAAWWTDVPLYSAVEYLDVYPGIDLRYYGNDTRLEYDFVVQPGADPAPIALRFAGAGSVRLDGSGSLQVGLTPGRSLSFTPPVAYQEVDGERVPVESAYRLEGDTVRFTLGAYEPSLPLVIDPTLEYSSYLGGGDVDQLFDVAADSTGASYVVGAAKIGYPTTVGAYQGASAGGFDVVVTKVAPDGQSLAYSTFIGGGADDFAFAVAVDGSGSAYITGETGSDDYPTSGPPFDGVRNGVDAFVTKLSPAGSALTYSTFLGGQNAERGDGIDVDASGNAYVVGHTLSTDFPTQSPIDGTLSGSRDAFVTKVNAAGGGLSYSTYLGGGGVEEATGVVVDGSSQAWVTGYTASTDFPTTSGTYQPTRGDTSKDVFVSGINAAGSALLYGTYLGGTSQDEGYGIDLDAAGMVYVTGIAQTTFPSTPGAWDTTFSSGDDIFVAKLDPSLTGAAELVYSGFVGDGGTDRGTDIAVDGYGQAHIVGYVSSSGLASGDGYDTTVNSTDGYVAIISSSGSAKLYATYLGGTSDDYGRGIALEGGKIHVVGHAVSTDFPRVNAYDSTASSDEGWLARFAAQAAPPSLTPAALWRRSGQNTPYTSSWNGSAFGSAQASASVGSWRIIESAESPIRDEAVAVGQDGAGSITAERWNGSAWSAASVNPIGSAVNPSYRGFDVAYESSSGEAMVVASAGTGLQYTVWNGTAWSSPAALSDYAALSGATSPTQVTLAASPLDDTMVLLATDNLGRDYGFSWSGSAWGAGQVLDATSGGDNTSSFAVADWQTGLTVAAYSKGVAATLYYRTWNGSSWSAEGSVTPPGGVSSKPMYVRLAADPRSRRIAAGVITSGTAGTPDVWLNVWDGTAWGTSTLATTTAVDQLFPGVSVAFEGTSGQAIAAYGVTGQQAVRYRTWAHGSGWSAEAVGPNVGSVPNTVALFSDVASDSVMLATQDAASDLNYTLWNGSAWGSPTELETNTGETSGQPFTFLWPGAAGSAVNDPPVAEDDWATTTPAVGVPVTVLTNDWDPEGAPLSVASVTQGAHGTVTHNGTTVTYTSSAGWTGSDSFTYSVTDGGLTDTATVTVLVTPPGTVIVNSTGDAADAAAGNGVCSTGSNNSQGQPACTLRAAIQEANASAAIGTIYFAIPTSESGYAASPVAFTIRPSSLLPEINTAMTIDGSTQVQYVTAGRPVVEIDGTNVTAGEQNGLWVTGGGSTIRGLVINRFGDDGIDVEFNGGNTIVGNYVGTDVTGTVARPNGWGINIKTPNNMIGGITAADRNVVSGNSDDGFYLYTATCTGNTIQGNYIGIGADGATPLGNSDAGVYLHSSGNGNTIGGTSPAARNVISSNGGHGIFVTGSGTNLNLVRGNYIGTDALGGGSLGNGGWGVYINSGAANNQVGGTGDGAGNTIRNNTAGGVAIVNSSTGNRIARNLIHGNTGFEIDLAANGATNNDGSKTSGQPNLLMDYPVITSAVLSGSTLSVTGYVGSAAGQATFAGARVEVFEADADASNRGGATVDLGSFTADGSGNFSAQLTVAGLAVGEEIAATATDASGNTSEFGVNVVVASSTVVVNSTGDAADANPGNGVCSTGGVNSQGQPACTLRAAIQEANAMGPIDQIRFGLPTTEAGHAAGVWTIAPTSALPPISAAVTIDASTQPGWSSTPVVELNGTSAGGTTDGLRLVGDGVTVRGFAINRFGGDGIEVDAVAQGAVIAGNHLGVDASGTIDRGNGERGVDLQSGSGPTTVGGAGASDRNVISGNGLEGMIVWESDGNTIIGNRIGTNAAGTAAIGNGSDGVHLGSTSSNNQIGQPGAGNVISGNPNDGIELDDTISGNVIQSNIIGLGADGTTVVANGRHGVVLYNGVNTTQIGGSGAGEGNVISGNAQDGVHINGNGNVATTGNLLEGNYIGTDAAGLLDRGNGAAGLNIFGGAGSTTVGGATSGHRNVISGNGTDGIYLQGVNTTGTIIRGNYIGVDITGNGALPNGDRGVQIESGANGTIVGGSVAGQGNVISANGNDGIIISDGAIPGTGTTGTAIEGNKIGVGVDGTTPLGNGTNGVRVTTEDGHRIGGTAVGAGNVIAHNVTRGVDIQNSSANNNPILGNSIHSNGNVGIDLADNGVTPNDAGDGDSGANDLLNFPVITSAVASGGTVTVTYDLDVPAGNYRVEFFKSSAADGSGYGEGETFLSAVTATPGTGRTHSLSGSAGDIITATATRDLGGGSFGSTSEFSAVGYAVAQVVTVNSTGDAADASPGNGVCSTGGLNSQGQPACTLRAAIQEANASAVIGAISFNIPTSEAGHSGGVWTISPTSALPAVSAPVTIDATTQSGWSANSAVAPAGLNGTLVVQVDGVDAGASTSGFTISSGGSGSTLRGLVINRFGGSGVQVSATGVAIAGCYIGTDPGGSVDRGNGVDGITISAGGAVVGGSNPADRNLLSGNGDEGVDVDAGVGGVVVVGNLIGTTRSGSAALGNGASGWSGGVLFDGSNNRVGGTAAGEANVISGNAPYGVILNSGTGNTIQGNYIGVGSDGVTPVPNTTNGIVVSGSASNVIGGTTPAAANVVSGNGGDGIFIELASATGNLVQGNLVGLGSDGSTVVANAGDGIDVNWNAGPHTIGGSAAGAGNVVSGNAGAGIRGYGTDNLTIAGNRIGVDASGTLDRGNGSAGIHVNGDGAVIGGATAAAGNVVSGNGGYGVYLDATTNAVVRHNRIGTNAAGTAAVANGNIGILVSTTGAILADNLVSGNVADGIQVSSGSTGVIVRANTIGADVTGSLAIPNAWAGIRYFGVGGLIGGTGQGEGNLVAFNAFGGIVVGSSGLVDNTILGNAIFSNGGLGIDLADNGVTLNDAGDADTGANELLNFPEITSAIDSGGTANVSFSLDVPAGTYRVEFFVSSAADPTGYGEGQTLVHAETVVHPGGGSAAFSASFSGSPGDIITATTTESMGAGGYGSTSEFSAAAYVATQVVTVNSTGDAADAGPGNGVCSTGGLNSQGQPACTLRAAIQEANAHPVVSTIRFNIPTTEVGYSVSPLAFTITPATSLPALTAPAVIDGSTQPEYAAAARPVVQLVGTVAGGVGLTVAAGPTTVQGLVVNRFVTGVAVTGGNGSVIAGNFLGPDVTGMVGEVGNSGQGLLLSGSTNTVVGGAGADRNVISGNRQRGIWIDDYSDGAPVIITGTRILGNLIGPDAAGTGLLAYSGGATPAYQQIGVAMWDGSTTAVGGSGAGEGNVISGNSWYGVYVWGPNGGHNTLEGNTVGLSAGGAAPLGNGFDSATRAGILISNSPGNRIGGTGAGQPNTIAGNASMGVAVSSAGSTGTAILGNSIYSNGGLGIDLAVDGVTLNDPGDGDTGPNDLLNFPVVGSVLVTGGTVDVSYTLDVPAGVYRVDFFVSSASDPSGYGEGETLVHTHSIVHPGGSPAMYGTSFSGAAGDTVTATITADLGGGSYGATSEFSQAVVVDTPPVAADDSASTAEDAAVAVDVLTNDSDVDGDPLTVESVTQGSHGLVATDGATVTYTPDVDWHGTDTFSYTVTDGTATDIGTVTVTVTPVNDPPAVVDDAITTVEDTPVTLSVLGNDADVDGDPLTVDAVTQGSHGSVATDGVTVTYTPDPDWNGTDTFSYTVTDGTATDTATVTVAVGPVNDPPVAVDDAASTAEDAAVGVDVLANDSDVDGDSLTVESVTQGAHGSVTTDGATVTYTPDPDWSGTDTFSYTVTDGTATDIGTVTVTVTPVNDAPAAADDAITTVEDTPVTLSVLGNDGDLDGDPLTVQSVTQGAHGVVTTDGTTVTYTPDPDWSGTDTFSYTVSDGTATDIGTVTLTVTPVNDPPVAGDDAASTAEDAAVGVDVLSNDSDVDGDPISVQSVTQGTNGSVTTDGTTIVYTPDPDWHGTDTFAYTVTDGTATDIGTVTVTVTPVNDAPAAAGDAVTTVEDTPVTVTVLGNDSDVDGDPLAVESVTQGAHGVVTTDGTTVTYTPEPDWSGTEMFSYTVSDGVLTDTGTVTVTVDPASDTPIANDDAGTTPEDVELTLAVLTNDVDADGDPLTVESVTQGAHGVVTTDGTTVTYTPDADWTGSDTVTYTVTDGVLTDIGTVTVTVTPVNDPPAAGDDAASTAEDTAVGVDVLSNDSDVDGDPLTVDAVTQGANGTVATDGATVTYTPDPDWSGTDSFAYTVTDGVLSDTATVTVAVGPVNDPPVAGDDAASAAEDTAVVVDVLANDSDVDGDSLSVQSVTQGSHGLVATDGVTVTYTPDPDWHGTDTFSYTVSDGSLTDTALVAVTVTPVNDPPAAVDDAVTTAEDTPVTETVLANDTDVDGDPLTVDAVTQGEHGTVSTDGASVTYTPDPDWNGTDTFSYTVSDGVLSDTATVTVTVTPVNDLPVAADDSASTAEDAAVAVDVLTNDSDVDGDPLTVESVTQGSHGLVATDGATVTYTPDVDWHGTDTFSYTVTDGTATDIGTVTVTVTPVNDPPAVVDDAITTVEDTPVTLSVLGNDADVDGDPLTVDAVTQGSHGSVATDGVTVTYTPDPDWNGTDTFSYTVTDGTATDTATVTVAVGPVNDPPVAVDDAASTAEDAAVGVDVLANDSDVDGDSLTVESVTQGAHGSVTTDGATVTYTPDPDWSGTDTFSYTVTDGTATDIGTVTVTVTPVNDAPAAADDAITTVEDTPVTLSVLGNDGDLDGDPLTVQSVTQGAHGVVTTDGTTVTYTPDPDWSGTDTFSYTVSDGTATDIGTVTLTVTPVNDPPVAGDDAASTAEDAAVGVDVLSNDSDVDGDPISVQSVTQGTNGSVTTDGTTIVYTPDPDWHGTDTFAYTVTDGTATDIGTVTVTVTPVNDAPAAAGDAVTTVEDTPVTVTVLGNDSDVDGDPLAVESVTQGAHGVVTTDGTTVTYTPEPDWSGTEMFSYTVSDGVLTDTGTVTVTVDPASDTPIANDDAGTTPEDVELTLAVLTNDVDADGDPLTVESVTQGAHGVVTTDGTTVTYTPDADWTGSDTVTYTVTDGVLTDIGTVTVTVTPVNDPPAAGDDAASTAEDTAVGVDVLSNDSDVDGDPLTVDAVTQGANGTVATDGATVTYTPDPDWSGTDSFAYTVTDGVLSDTATVTVAVGPVNDPPVAGDDAASAAEDTAVVVDVLANDSDVDGDSLSVQSVTQGSHGLVATDGVTVTYTPDPDWHGTDTFSYTVSDGSLTDTALVAVTVTPVNDPPAAVDDAVTTAEDTPVTETVLANDTDVDGDPLTVDAVTQGAHGSVTTDGSTLTYTPGPDFVGADSFTYTVTDGLVVSGPVTVTVTVDPAADAPIANDDAGTTPEEVALALAVLVNDVDVDGDPLTVDAVTQGANGTVTTDGTTVTYTPDPDWHGIDTFSYTVTDGTATDIGTVTVTVTPVNDPPAVVDDAITTVEDTPVAVTVLGNDADVDGDPLTVTAVTQGSHGSVATDGVTVTYTPDPDWTGSDTVTYTVTDGALTAAATVTVTVTPVNDSPAAVDDAGIVPEDAVLWLTVLGNDTDIDGDPLSVDAITQGSHGSVTTDGTAVAYTPDPDWNGTDTFTYTVTDGTTTDTATVTVTVTPVNDAPTLLPVVGQTVDEAVLLVLVAGAIDPDAGDTLAFALVGAPAGMTIDPVFGAIAWTPTEAQGPGVFTFDVVVSDAVLSDSRTVTVTVVEVNADPIAFHPGDQVMAEGDAVSFSVVAADPDLPSNTLMWSASGLPPGLSIDPATGVIGGTVGTDAGDALYPVTVSVEDGVGGADSVAFQISTFNTNRPPVLGAVASPAAAEGSPLSLTVTAFDPDGDALTYSLVGAPAGASIDPATGALSWIPGEAQGPGIFSFDVMVTDNGSPTLSDAVTLSVAVAEVNQPPVASSDAYQVAEGGILTVPAPGVLANDSDPDLPPGPLAAILLSGPAHASGFALSGDGSFTYVHDGGASPTDEFTYAATDGVDQSPPVTVVLTVLPANDPPTVTGAYFQVQENGPAGPVGSITFSDPEGGAVAFAIVAGNADGAFSIDGSGLLSVGRSLDREEAPFRVLSVRVTDSAGAEATALVTVEIINVNEAPSITGGRFEVSAGLPAGTVVGTVGGSDPDGDPLTYAVDGGGGFAVDPRTGLISTTRPLAAGETHRLTVTVADPGGLAAAAEVSIAVAAGVGSGGDKVPGANRAPVAVDDAATTNEDTAVEVEVLANDRDPDGDPLRVVAVSSGVGTAQVLTGGMVRYVPAPNWSGQDEVVYRVSDPAGAAVSARLVVDVLPVNDPPRIPFAEELQVEIRAGTEVVITLPPAVDADGDALRVLIDPPQHGTAELIGPGRVRYVPESGFSGEDSIRFRIVDPFGAAAFGVITIRVTTFDGVVVAVDLALDSVGVLGSLTRAGDPPAAPRLPGMRLLFGSLAEIGSLFRLPLIVFVIVALLSLLGGLRPRFQLTRDPLPVTAERRRWAVVLVPEGHQLVVHAGPDSRHAVVRRLDPTYRGLMGTGRSAGHGSLAWVEVTLAGGEAWVPRLYVTELVEPEVVLGDQRIEARLDALRLAAESGGAGVEHLLGPKGIHVSVGNLDTTATPLEARDFLAGLDPSLWWSLGTALHGLVQPNRPAVAPVPVTMANFPSVAVRHPLVGRWRLFFDYVDGEPHLVGIWQEARVASLASH
jgi:CSLREA domain-containing protein